ncbi:C-type lectin 1-like [Procambarus clarkii]|uniref:C-type lectin 1-like n=1 Tax=Procambarus clarkii TaxID=6728 RepID=UPI0037427F82
MYSLLLLAVVVVAGHPVSEKPALEELRSAVIASPLMLPHQTSTRQLPSTATRRDDHFPHGPTCPYPYTLVLDECFYLSPHKVKWEAARRHCKGMMGDLATPKHLYAIRSFLLDVIQVEGLIDIVAHVGFRKESNGPFQWLDGRLVNAADFGAGEPNNNGEEEYCGEFRQHVEPMLNDISCSTLARFLCQYYPIN